MSDAELRELVDALGRLLAPHLERSEPARRAVELIGRWLVAQAQGASAETAAPMDESEPADPPVLSIVPAAEDESSTSHPHAPVSPLPPAARPLRTETVALRLGGYSIAVPVLGTPTEIAQARESARAQVRQDLPAALVADKSSQPDLKLIESRCRVKADACSLYIERHTATHDESVDIELERARRAQELITRAKGLRNCYLWVLNRERTQPDDATVAVIGEAYRALADASALMAQVDGLGRNAGADAGAEAMQFLAEASSSLRAALAATWLTRDDHDELDAHVWLRRETSDRRVIVPRFMQLDDPADPNNVADLIRRIAAARTRIDTRGVRAKAVAVGLNRMRYHARRLADADGQGDTHDWRKIAGALIELADAGIPPTDPRVAEALAPAARLAPPESVADSALGRALEAARRWDEPDSSDDRESGAPRAWSQRVLDVRRSVAGRRFVVIGGERKVHKAELLREAFELEEVDWIALTEHGSGEAMRAPIRQKNVAAVLVIVKLAGHLHVEEARQYADAAGTPCVLLKAGYNPEQVAEAIMAQASVQLALNESRSSGGTESANLGIGR